MYVQTEKKTFSSLYSMNIVKSIENIRTVAYTEPKKEQKNKQLAFIVHHCLSVKRTNRISILIYYDAIGLSVSGDNNSKI